MTDLTLYDYFRSSAAYRVRIALNLKGLAHDVVPTSLLAGEQKSEEYRALNPQGFVPALVTDDGTVLTQSLAIIDWLDQTYPEPRLIPVDNATLRARVMAMALTIACDIHPLNNLRVLKYLQSTLGLRDAIRDIWYRHWVSEGFAALEAMAVDISGPFLAGTAEPTIADVFLVPQMYNARRFEVDLAPYPRLVAVDAAAQALPAFAAAAPERVKPAD